VRHPVRVINKNPDKLQSAAHWATIVGVVVAIVAILFGFFTYEGTADLQQETTAYTLYREHLQLCFEHPDYASASKAVLKDAKYEWFVANALHSADAILVLRPKDDGWRETIKEVIRIHQEYIRDKSFPREHYSPMLLKLIDETLAEEKK
jgi:hypothetical protein